MHIDIALATTKQRLTMAGIRLDDKGEVQVVITSGSRALPIRFIVFGQLLVVTAEPALDPNLTARWIGKLPSSTSWNVMPRRWDQSQQGWICEVRKHVPEVSADP